MNFLYFDTIDSTNDYLKNNYNDLNDLTFVSCRTQTSGKGRSNRKWYSDGNNLLFSLLIKNKELISKYKDISIITAYSIIEVLKEYKLNNLYLKWPNDIYVGNKKICGILLEAISKVEIECLIVGVGLNINQKIFNEDYINEPTSISLELNKDLDIEILKDKVYKQIELNLKRIENDYDFYSKIKELDYLKNKEVYAFINNQKQKVKVIGIDLDYSLKVILDGNTINLNSGEISFHLEKEDI